MYESRVYISLLGVFQNRGVDERRHISTSIDLLRSTIPSAACWCLWPGPPSLSRLRLRNPMPKMWVDSWGDLLESNPEKVFHRGGWVFHGMFRTKQISLWEVQKNPKTSVDSGRLPGLATRFLWSNWRKMVWPTGFDLQDLHTKSRIIKRVFLRLHQEWCVYGIN